MKLGNVMALVLLMAVVSPMLPGQVHISVQPGAAGCPEHGQKAPAPAPVSYQCCRAGHQFAAVRESVNFRAPFLPVSRVVEFGVTPWSELVYQTALRSLALGPPGVRVLRI